LMQNSSDRQSTTTTSPRTTRLDDQSVKNVTSQVIEELRQRQATVRREGR
jgi:membrane protease subunit HflK